MDSDNIFLRTPDKYKRNLKLVDTAIADASHYLSLETGKSLDESETFIRNYLKEKDRIKPISLKVTKRQSNGDRVKDKIDIDSLLNYVEKTNSVLAPNVIVYDSAEQNKSCLANYVDKKMADRSIIKKAGFKAKMENNKVLASYCSNSEAGIKLLINSLSGAHASPHNSLYNKTAHSSLTSLCRVGTSYSNANTERMLMGNRHYWSANVTMGNILSVTRNTDYNRLKNIIKKYNLYIPTTDEVLKLILRSTHLYWKDPIKQKMIDSLVNKLNDLERASFVYTGDLYHLAKFNDDIVRDLITNLISTPNNIEVDNIDLIIKKTDPDIIALVGILCSDILDGGTVDSMKNKSIENYKQYARTIKHINTTFKEYSDLLVCLLITDNLPPSIFNFPNSIRRCVVGGDTDSTMFTCQNWIEWYFKKLVFSHEANKVSSIIIYLNVQVIGHILAYMSKQLGVDDSSLYNFKMKNEFSFPVYMRANRAKHYATLITACEGNVYKEPEVEIKGVALKDSKKPPKIIKGVQDEINNSLLIILANGKIDIDAMEQRIANTEHEIYKSINSGNIEYLSFMTIKQKDAYKKPMSSNYLHYDLWTNVFEDKYGKIDVPPYRVVKLSSAIDSSILTNEWVKTLDLEIQEKINKWMEITGKKAFGMLLLPAELFEAGLPKEFISLIDKRKLVSELMESAYILFEMSGFYFKNKHNTNLLSDDIPYKPEYGIVGNKK